MWTFSSLWCNFLNLRSQNCTGWIFHSYKKKRKVKWFICITLPIRFTFGLNCLCRFKKKNFWKKNICSQGRTPFLNWFTIIIVLWHLLKLNFILLLPLQKLSLESIPHIMTQNQCSERTKMRFLNLFQIPLYRMLTKW